MRVTPKPTGVGVTRTEINLKAKRFRASALQPFLRGAVAELDGEIDANADLKLGGESTMTGYLALEKGRFQLESVGEEFRNARARVELNPDGRIVVEDASAQGSSGKVSADAWAKLDGMRLVAAHAHVKIPKREPLPIVIEGEPLAEAWGNIALNVRADPQGATEITVEVPSAGIRLPDKSSHDLQSLGRPEAIRVGIQRTPKEFVVLALSDAGKRRETPSEVTQVKLELRNVEVRRSTTLRAVLEGKLDIESAGETSIRGQITLRSGILEVQGKRFEIERGLISFVGDPSNPEVVVTAGWTAPEGTRVYADFIGPLKTGKVTLRAEPPHSQSEILSLILFGTTDGQAVPVSSSQQQSSDSGSGVASGAVGIGGSIATQGLNRALDDLTGLDITTRIDTTDSSNPRPEVELQIAQDISLSIAHVLGMSSAETNLDRNFLILDWRFTRNWSLETTFGDKGSTIVDAVWQRRY
jgi:translocation and assembly module TamB